LAATSADWDPSFIDRLASVNEIILLDTAASGFPRITERPSISPSSPTTPGE